MGPLSKTSRPTLQSAIEQCNSARDLLSAAIQSYLEACTSLHTACEAPIRQPNERVMFQDVLKTADSELDSLASTETDIRGIRTSLAAIKNHHPYESWALARINILPPEILINIFALSKAYCSRDTDKASFYNFASVCAYWRNIALDSPGLWSHIDLGLGRLDELTSLLIECTRCGPIHIHMYEPKPITDRPPSRDQVSDVLCMFTWLRDQIKSLQVETYSNSRSIVSPVLNEWLCAAKASLARSLTVYRPNASMMLIPQPQSEIAERWNRKEDTGDISESLSILRLWNVRFGWNSAVYRGLVDLQLSFSCDPSTVTMSELVSIFSSSSGLSTLKLSHLNIIRTKEWVRHTPIELYSLRLLTLFHIDSDSLRLLLPSIRLPTSPVEVGIGPVHFSQIYDELKSLIAHSHVHSLYCRYDKQDPLLSWVSLPKLAPHLRNLVLDELRMTNEPLTETDTGRKLLLQSSTALDYVLFVDSVVTLDGLRVLIDALRTRRLHFERCKSLDGGTDDGMEKIRASLAVGYPEVMCIISDTRTTERMEYCSMFGQ